MRRTERGQLIRNKNRLVHNAEFYESALSDPAHTKKCSGCEKTLHIRNFYKEAAKKSGFASKCRKCAKARTKGPKARNYYLKRRYGITLENYNVLLKNQSGLCAICKQKCTSGRKLAVDHCHKGGHVRGLLCGRCNRGIGYLREDSVIVLSALNYLLRF